MVAYTLLCLGIVVCIGVSDYLFLKMDALFLTIKVHARHVIIIDISVIKLMFVI